MKNKQSYNHFMPQSIIKLGWGYKLNKNKYVNVLNYDRLRNFIADNPSFSKDDLINVLKQNYGEEENKHNYLVTRRNTDSIMGNKLIYNLTEDNLGYTGHNIEKDIEHVMFELLKKQSVDNVSLNLIYKWFSLQKARAFPEFIHFYDNFLKQYKLLTINHLKDYSLFKESYNKRVKEYYNYYLKNYQIDGYRYLILKPPKEFFLFLGETNTLSAANFSNIIFEHHTSLVKNNIYMTYLHYGVLHCIDISIISKDRILLLMHPIVPYQIAVDIATSIFYTWNFYQSMHEQNTLVIPQNFDDEFTQNFIDCILYQHNLKTIEKNQQFFSTYRTFLKQSILWENELKKQNVL